MHAHAIPQVEAAAIGNHLIWIGPQPWLYSPGGWSIQRRVFQGRGEVACDTLAAADLTDLRLRFEASLDLGLLSFRRGFMPTPLDDPGGAQGLPAEIFTYTLHEPQPLVEINLQGAESFAFGLRGGKVVAVSGVPQTGSAAYTLSGLAIEAVVLYARGLQTLQFCIPRHDEEDDWSNEPFIVKNLQLPLRELMPALDTPDKEFAEALARIPPGGAIDEEAFKRLTAALRPGVQQAGPLRPIDQVLLLRDQNTADFEELITLDPLRVMAIHPTWRSAIGLGFFDQDPTLVADETYEYRITGQFPAQDLADKVYGFHSVPSQTALPADFYLHDMHFLLPQPGIVRRAPGSEGGGLARISRRGIRLLPRDKDFWEIAVPFDEWSLVINLPQPVEVVILELHKQDHDLTVLAQAADNSFIGPLPVPKEPNPRLSFTQPVKHLRLAGEGFLFAIRIPSGPQGMEPLSVVLPPVTLQNTPRPDPPLRAEISNLQHPLPAADVDIPAADPPSRPALGFQVMWRPATQQGVKMWPLGEPAAPPVESTLYQIEQRQVFLAADESTIIDSGEWTPLLGGENWVTGDRDRGLRSKRLKPHVDLMQVYPESPRRSDDAGIDLFYQDVFDFTEGDNAIVRPLPPLGTFHQYRVRAIDEIGRASTSWTETNVLRLEKRVPPPIPVGPQPAAGAPSTLPDVRGVQVRVLVKDAPDLTPAERTRLGSDDNLILLRWGYHDQQREQDPFTREFRLYVAEQTLDAVPGQITAVSEISPGIYDASLTLDRPVPAGTAQGSHLQAGYPFFIASHSGGSSITARLEARLPDATGDLPRPALMPVRLPQRLLPDKTRPPAWSERFAVEPLTAATSYEVELRNRLVLSAQQPRDSIWVGVSAADDQAYVADQLAPAQSRPGNESAIVPILCTARYHGRPQFDVPPALDPVPVLVAPEPDGRPVYFALDLRHALTSSGLAAGDLILPERLSADSVAAAYFVSPSDQIMARAIEPREAGESDEEVIVPNPADRAAIITALNDARTTALEDRFVLFLAGSHPYRDRLFEAAVPDAVAFGPFQETLPSKSGRYVYRVRKSDQAGHLSRGGVMAALVVRVPSLVPGALPQRAPFVGGDPPERLRFLVPAQHELTHLLTFSQQTAVGANGSGPLAATEILRTPNRPDLYPAAGLFLRAPDGALLTPRVTALDDPAVTVDDAGVRQVPLDFSAPPGERVRVWACSLTQDGVPSAPAGPWTLAMPLPPLPEPLLSGSLSPSGALDFSWSWPPGRRFEAALEQSADGVNWRRISPLFGGSVTSYVYTQRGGTAAYRLRLFTHDNRSGHSNTIMI